MVEWIECGRMDCKFQVLLNETNAVHMNKLNVIENGNTYFSIIQSFQWDVNESYLTNLSYVFAGAHFS